MIFLAIQEPLEDFLKRDENERFNANFVDWCLFDATIGTKSLTKQKSSSFGTGNLRNHIDRIMYYNIYYKEPMYCYLMTERYFKRNNFRPKDFQDVFCHINMKRVPHTFTEDWEYPKIPKGERLFGDDFETTNRYIVDKFKELTTNNVAEIGVKCVVLDGKYEKE